MSTYDWLDLQTLGSQLVMSKNLANSMIVLIINLRAGLHYGGEVHWS